MSIDKKTAWVCIHPDGTVDHNWRIRGDSNEGGTWYWRECTECGAEDHDTPVTYADLEDFE